MRPRHNTFLFLWGNFIPINSCTNVCRPTRRQICNTHAELVCSGAYQFNESRCRGPPGQKTAGHSVKRRSCDTTTGYQLNIHTEGYACTGIHSHETSHLPNGNSCGIQVNIASSSKIGL